MYRIIRMMYRPANLNRDSSPSNCLSPTQIAQLEFILPAIE